MKTHIIEKCYILVKKNRIRHIDSYHLTDFYLSLEEVYNTISSILRIDFSLLNDLDKLLEVICVKLTIDDNSKIESFCELTTLSLKEIESSLIPF